MKEKKQKTKRKKKITARYVHERLFNAEVVLIVCEWEDFLPTTKKWCTPDKFQELKPNVEKHGHDKWCLATQFPFGGGGSIIWANPKAGLSTLVHEVTHAAHHLLSTRAVPLSVDTEEVYAYLVEFFFKHLLKQ